MRIETIIFICVIALVPVLFRCSIASSRLVKNACVYLAAFLVVIIIVTTWWCVDSNLFNKKTEILPAEIIRIESFQDEFLVITTTRGYPESVLTYTYSFYNSNGDYVIDKLTPSMCQLKYTKDTPRVESYYFKEKLRLFSIDFYTVKSLKTIVYLPRNNPRFVTNFVVPASK
jgi:hypothetical protein